MIANPVLTWALFIAIIPFLSVSGSNCTSTKWTSDKTITCPIDNTEIYKHENSKGHYKLRCCLSGTEDELEEKRHAHNCRATKCLGSAEDQICSTLGKRFIEGKRLKYEEVMRETCTKGKNDHDGEVALCCLPNSHEEYLLTTIGAEHHEFPHQAKIKPYNCGGTVYNKRFIITACHCVVDDNGDLLDPTDWTVILGTNIADMNSTEYVYRVKKIIPHERYSLYAKNDQNERKNKHGVMYNDIALLELKDDIKFSKHIKSLEIAPANFNPFEYSDKVVVVGWGTTEALTLPVHLHKTNLILRQDDRCFSHSGKWKHQEKWQDQLLCLGGIKDGQYSDNSREGDSGGPAICRNANGKPVLCGITSFGGKDDDCVRKRNAKTCPPSGFVDVSYFRKWIKSYAGKQNSSTFYDPYLYGKEVASSEYEHQVHITLSDGKSCGGTLVQPDVVVTAAQCVMKADGSVAQYSDLTVVTGIDDLKSGQGMRFEVSDFRVLEGFKMHDKPVDVEEQGIHVMMTDNFYNNDLAVLKLKKTTSLKQRDLPHLPSNKAKFRSGLELAFPRNITMSGKLRSREFSLLDLSECRKRMKRYSGYTKDKVKVDDNLLCGVEKYSGGSTCDRELGGGLICKDSDGKNFLCGVQVFRLCEMSIPNGFIDMAKYGEWVETKISEMG